jgi:hypothetical protein
MEMEQVPWGEAVAGGSGAAGWVILSKPDREGVVYALSVMQSFRIIPDSPAVSRTVPGVERK